MKTDFDELEGDDDEGFCGTGRGTGEDGEGLSHLSGGEDVEIEFTPGIVCSEFCGSGVLQCSVSGLEDVIIDTIPESRDMQLPFGCFHENGSADTAVESGEAFILDDLTETVHHAIVVVYSAAFACL